MVCLVAVNCSDLEFSHTNLLKRKLEMGLCSEGVDLFSLTLKRSNNNQKNQIMRYKNKKSVYEKISIFWNSKMTNAMIYKYQ